MSGTKSEAVTERSRYRFTKEDCRRGGSVNGHRAVDHLPLHVQGQMVLLHEAGKSYGEIAKHLNEMGLQTQQGATFRRETVKRLIGRLKMQASGVGQGSDGRKGWL